MNLTHALTAATYLAGATLVWAAEPVRLDHIIRGDFFAGLRGNAEAMARGMKATEAVLEQNPNHAEALVWHGSGMFFQAGQAFQHGDPNKGMALFGKSIAEMDRAVELEPGNLAVRIPRGSTLMAATRLMGSANPMVPSLREKALSDFLGAYELQKNNLDKMGTHPRGELLFGIADTYARQGNTAKADEFFALLAETSKDTPYAERAATWKQTRQPLPPAQANCIGCHVK